MDQYSFATLIQRAYRIINSADDAVNLLDSICKLLSVKSEFLLVWVDSKDNSGIQRKIFSTKNPSLLSKGVNFITENILNCESFNKDDYKGKVNIISSITDKKCYEFLNSHFNNSSAFAILSEPIQFNNYSFGTFNILSSGENNFSAELIHLIKELCADVGSKIYQLRDKSQQQKCEGNFTLEKDDYFRTLLHCMYEDIVVINSDYNVVDVNNSRLKISGKKTEEILGEKCFKVLHGFDKPCNYYGEECPIKEVFNSGETRQVRHTCKTDNGKPKVLDILFSPFKNDKGEVIRVIETIRNVTDNVEKEEELKEKQFQLKQIANNLDVVFFKVDLSCRKPKITYLSEAFTKILGVSTSDALKNQKIWYSAVFPDDRRNIFHIMREYVRTKNPNIKTEFRIMRPDDTIRWISVRTRFIADYNGGKQIFGIAEDITEKKLLELELQNAYAKAKESINFKNYLLGNVNHEIRTPLNAILGFTQILKEEDNKELIDELTDKILTASNRLLTTLDSIIELSDLQSDNRKLQFGEVSVIELLKIVKHKFYSVAKEKNLLFEVIEPDQDIVIKSDEYLLKKILIQLLDNAFKYTHNGSVTLSVRFNISEKDNWLVVDVSDTGIGIEPEKLETIFEAFRQGSEGLARSYQGTGLGLTLTKKMIQLLNGKITVESEKGIGSKFSVYIPFDFPDSKLKKNEKGMPKQFNGTNRILIVEDNELNAEVLKHFLKDVVITDVASDASETFELVSKYFYNLILMDISLKNGESGIEVMKKIKQMPNYSSVPVIALTAYTFDEDKNKFLSEGFDGFIPKPIKKENLITEIKSYLNSKARLFV